MHRNFGIWLYLIEMHRLIELKQRKIETKGSNLSMEFSFRWNSHVCVWWGAKLESVCNEWQSIVSVIVKSWNTSLACKSRIFFSPFHWMNAPDVNSLVFNRWIEPMSTKSFHNFYSVPEKKPTDRSNRSSFGSAARYVPVVLVGRSVTTIE